ncbi:hypothetical protein IW147_004188 [Coemansia sp. RSA 720]|nr:hypothetical protein IW147_004188 [Coemansia sp. RSA 720]
MSSQNMLGGPDEDEHYEIRELGHPNKAFRNMHGQAGTFADARAAEIINEEHSRALQAVSAAMEADALIRPQLLRPQLMAPTSRIETENSGTTTLEKVRASKNKAIEILQLLEAESGLERPVSEYIQDVEASYNESDPKITHPKIRAAWMREEDRLLMVGVCKYGPNTESWPRIAMLVPGRTNKSCRKRWFHSLDPSLHKGPWTAEEDEMLRQRVTQFPSQWSRVAEGIPGRTDDQCAKRWRESLDPDIDRSKWTPQEDRLLLKKYDELGTQWQKIASSFKGRPGLHCRNRWRKIHRVISQKDKKKGRTGKDFAEDLALVTESVNRRKTAQRSRPQGKGTLSTAPASLRASAEIMTGSSGMDGQAVFPFSSLDVSPRISGSSTGTVGYEQAFVPDAQRLHSHSQEHLYAAMPQFGISASIIGSNTSSNGTTFDETAVNFPAYMQRATVGVNAPQLVSPPQNPLKVGSPETMGALYMPSTEQPASASAAEGSLRTAPTLRQQASGVKRTSSVIYSPTDEQRQRLQQLKLKLYGCAAAPESCDAAFADAMSLNTHLKMVHSAVAARIPSLNIQNGAMAVTADSLATSMDASESMAMAAAVGGFGKGMVKAYRCAMPSCGQTYKNVNGLEYHIFQSRKAKSHFVWDAANDMAASEAATPETARYSSSPGLNPYRDASETYGANPSLIASGSNPGDVQLQCSEVDCLAMFGSEHELRQHTASQHPRPIRRAMKPSHKAKGRNGAYGSSTPHESGSVFWGSTSISDVLGASSMDAISASSISAMPMIPENEMSSAASNGITAAALAAAMGYQPHGSVAQTTPLFSPIQQPAATHRLHPHMAMPSHSFVQGTSAPFMSAPALISETGGEPNVNSYFTLGMNRQHMDTLTPFLVNPLPGSMAPVLAPRLPRRTITSYGNFAQHNVTPPRINHPEASSAIGSQAFAQGARSMESFQLEMELMQSMLSPFCAPGQNEPGTELARADNDGDVRMGQGARSQRSDSVDLTSLATVPANAVSWQPNDNVVESPVMAPQSLSKSGTHSQMATAVMSRLGRETASGQSTANQNLTLTPWEQDLSALGLLPVPSTSTRNSLHEAIAPQQRLYTPQPADLAQFQPTMMFHVDQPSTSLVNCPAPTCTQSFGDANALKHHVHFDHPRDETLAQLSNPGSPMEGLSTLPHTQRPVFSPAGSLSTMEANDRAKAPHWVDPSAWSTWIAAANGHGNVAAAAAATAMGITPGVSGAPHAFMQPQLPSTSAQMPDVASENELLKMFESITKDSPVNPTSSS